MKQRALWKGTLKLAEVICPVALYTAASTSDRIAFHTINRTTGHRVHRQFIDSDTGTPVDREDQVKGYELAEGDYIVLTPDDIAAALPVSDKVLHVQAFIPCDQVDTAFFDKPYYLAPDGRAAAEVFALLRDTMRQNGVAAFAQAVLFRRVRSLLIRADQSGLSATTLHFNYEVRSATEAFRDIPDLRIEGEMLDLARHIIQTKTGSFDPTTFDDRYETALADLVRAKQEGRKLPARKPPQPQGVSDLLSALRESAGRGSKPRQRASAKPRAAPRRKAG